MHSSDIEHYNLKNLYTMVFELDLIKKTYAVMPGKDEASRKQTGTPIT